MSLQPQIDIEIINSVLNDSFEKKIDPFRLNRLNKAIIALEKTDPINGFRFRALYYLFINEIDLSIDTIDSAIQKYGYMQALAEIKIHAYKMNQDWSLYKEVMENFLLYKDFEGVKEELAVYINESLMHIDCSGKFVEILKMYNVQDSEKYIEEIKDKQKIVAENGLSLATFRKITDLALSMIDNKYIINHTTHLRFDCELQLVLYSDYWSVDQTVELTQLINEAILSVNDLDFQLEADEIEVFCINFPINKLPKDFRFYEEDDESLTELIKSRISDSPKFEVLDV